MYFAGKLTMYAFLKAIHFQVQHQVSMTMFCYSGIHVNVLMTVRLIWNSQGTLLGALYPK